MKRSEDLQGLRATALQFEHGKSGARLLHVHSADTENCLAITFPTPPPDDTGLPHILEHAVLGGSRRFPVREPFFEMVKMSMATFINAMTYPAFTAYPVATSVKKDFFNLAEVYLDAVFHPELSESTFRREGHHLGLADNRDPDSPLRISGVVYSEMRGAYSAPETLMWQIADHGLFPDTPLGRDSGGNPDRIPDLTFARFRRFHEAYYRPGNALIFLYGDIPTIEHLRFLSPVLDEFDRRPAAASLPRQPRWETPRRVDREYPIGASEDAAARAFVALNWLVGDALDPACVTAWELLDRILLGNEAAPLRKAIVDSRLGSDVFFSGAWASAHEQEFHVGLKGTEPGRAGAFEGLVLDTLARIASEGIPVERVEAAFQQLSYEHLEVKTLFPLHLLDAVNGSWPYDGDPLTFLRMDRHLAECRRRYDADRGLFRGLIRDRLLENPHRLLAVLRPDCDAQARSDAALAARLAAKRATLPPAAIAVIGREAAALEAAQGEPNPPEALAKLPQLKVHDLPAKPRHIPTEVLDVAGFTVLRNDVFANGVNYIEIDVDLAGLPPDLYAFLPRFSDAVGKMGAAGESFSSIAERRAACTGGLGCSPMAGRHVGNPSRSLCSLRFGLKTLDEHAERALRLMGDLMFAVEPRDRERLRDVIMQSRADYRTSLISDGLGTARRQAARGLTPEGALGHLFASPDALRRVEEFVSNFEGRAEDLIQGIQRIRDFLPLRDRWTVSFTGSDSAFAALTRSLGEWQARMRAGVAGDQPLPFRPYATPPREGLAGPMDTAFCARVMPAPHLSHPAAPLFGLGLYLVTFDYLLPAIRFKGNAYGAGAAYDEAMGTCRFYSYRDPHMVETLAVFDRLRDFAGSAAWTQTDIDRAIIGSAKDAEKPIRPGEATSTALLRHVRGDTRERREHRYETLLSATPGRVRSALVEQLEAHEQRAAICIVSSREKLGAANRTLGAAALSLSNILP